MEREREPLMGALEGGTRTTTTVRHATLITETTSTQPFSASERSNAAATVHPLSAGLRPCDEEAAWKSARDVAERIHYDMHELSSLESQRALLNCGSLLKRSLPLSTLDARAEGLPIFASELLPYEGEYKEFEDTLNASRAGPEQKQYAIAVTQASGSGKTKLAYAHGWDHSLMILIRVVKQRATGFAEVEYVGAWSVFFDCIQANADASKMKTKTLEEHRRLARSALAALRLLVAAYAQWVAMVVYEYSCVCNHGTACKSTAVDSESASQYREVALRCLRNGRGDREVKTLYERLLANFSKKCRNSTDAGDDTTITWLSPAHIQTHVKHIDEYLRTHLLWPECKIVVWYDEAQMLLDKGKVFMSLSTYKKVSTIPLSSEDGLSACAPDGSAPVSDAAAAPREEGDVPKDAADTDTDPSAVESKDVMYGLTALMAWLTDEVAWYQVVCGPWLELSNRVRLPEYSCMNGRMHAVHHVSRIRESDMISSLQKMFDVELQQTTIKLLRRLQGRPRWFFDNFWPSLWVSLREYWVTREKPLETLSKELLLEFIEVAAKAAVKSSQSNAERLVTERWQDLAEASPGAPALSTLCRELYAAIKMNDGLVKVLPGNATEDAVKYGILALQPGMSGSEARLKDEPLIADALESYGDNLVGQAYHKSSQDPIEILLSQKMGLGEIAQFDLTTSVKGSVLEIAFAWHVVRLRLCLRLDRHPTLQQILESLLPSGFQLPANVATRLVQARYAIQGSCQEGRYKMNFHLFEPGSKFKDYVVYNNDKAAGFNAGFAAVQADDDSDRVLVSVQANTQKDSSLIESLRAATPAWQFIPELQRNAMVKNQWKADQLNTPLLKRSLFETFAASNADLVNHAIRVSVSVVGFRPESIAVCNKLNSEPPYDVSPIVLCEVKEGCNFPVSSELWRSCAPTGETADAKVAHSEQWQFWLPHTVADVSTARDTRGAVPTLPDETIKELRKISSSAKVAETAGSKRSRAAGSPAQEAPPDKRVRRSDSLSSDE